jgi:hypothetical protein
MTMLPRRSGSLALFVTFVLLAAQSISSAQQKPPPVKPLLNVYKTPTCGCCAKWVDHMRANGFDAKVQDLPDLSAVKAKLGVPAELGSCHTAQVGRYVIEGHIPADAVHRLLKERPTTVSGLAVPGMPMGSPGMEVPGGSVQPYLILTFDRQGQTTVYERRPR